MFPAEFDAGLGAVFNFAPEGWHDKIGVCEEDRELKFDAVAGGWTRFSLELVDGTTVFNSETTWCRTWLFQKMRELATKDCRRINRAGRALIGKVFCQAGTVALTIYAGSLLELSKHGITTCLLDYTRS